MLQEKKILEVGFELGITKGSRHYEWNLKLMEIVRSSVS